MLTVSKHFLNFLFCRELLARTSVEMEIGADWARRMLYTLCKTLSASFKISEGVQAMISKRQQVSGSPQASRPWEQSHCSLLEQALLVTSRSALSSTCYQLPLAIHYSLLLPTKPAGRSKSVGTMCGSLIFFFHLKRLILHCQVPLTKYHSLPLTTIASLGVGR